MGETIILERPLPVQSHVCHLITSPGCSAHLTWGLSELRSDRKLVKVWLCSATCAVAAVVTRRTQTAGLSLEASAAAASPGPQDSIATVPMVATGVLNTPWTN